MQWLTEFFTVLLYLTSNRKGGPGEFRVQNDPVQVKRPDSTSGQYLYNGIYDLRNAIRFKIWTRENPILANEIVVHDLHSLRTSTFNAKRQTKIFVHGKDHRSNEDRLDPETVYLRDAFLRFADVNFVLVDWTNLAKTYRYFTNYGDLVTDRLVDFIRFIERHGTPKSTLHLMGLSWGAHVVGNAGHKLGGKIGRITGLDAAGPLYIGQPPDRLLDKSDAMFVDLIHTDAGGLRGSHSGIPTILGHVDFFPNGGKGNQPGCPPVHWRFARELPCSHERAIDLFSESIGSPLSFPSCTDEKLQCNNENDNVTYMGYHLPVTTRGVYYLKTEGGRPYGLGTKMDLILPNIPRAKRARSFVFDFNRFRFMRLNSAYNNNNKNNNNQRSLETESGIVQTETRYSPSNNTNIEFLPNYDAVTPEKYPNNDILMQSLLIQKRLLKKAR